jgi:glycosyltransferase involved in cell wall biosynthesis
LNALRVALVHDWLTGLRGGERVLHEFAQLYQDADLYTLFHVPGSTTPAIDALRIHPSPLSRLPGVRAHYRKLLPLFPAAIERFDLSGYDLVVSCSHAVAKSVRVPPGTPHLCYCLTPMRYIWNHADAYLGNGLKRAISQPLVSWLRRFDQRTSTPERVTQFVAISTAVSDRIASCYRRDAPIVHPPVDTERITPSGAPPEDSYLMLGGFVPYKREDLAIDAFRSLDRELVIVGDGPMRSALERTAPGNVRFTGRVTDAELTDYYRRCRALIYPQEEDFGIAALEAQAAGRPVIAFGRGGALDTVRASDATDSRENATGVYFQQQTPAALRDAISRFEQTEHEMDPAAIRGWAETFSNERFRAAWQREVDRACPDLPR